MNKKIFYPPYSIAIPAALLLVILLISLFFILTLNKKNSLIEEYKGKYEGLTESILNPPQLDEGGTVGEVEDVKPSSRLISQTIYSTSGTITKIGEDFVSIRGIGDNFVDQQSRQLKVLVDEATIITNKDRTQRVIGLDGLGLLKLKDSVIVKSPQNIRGRTEFSAKYINVIY